MHSENDAHENGPHGQTPRDSWAVVVIHGVGTTSPGKTVDDFTATLLEANELDTANDRQAVYLPDKDKIPTERSDRQTNYFQVAYRHATAKGTGGILAEVYWADLSLTSGAFWGVIVSLSTLVFHTRYITDAAAAYNKGLLARTLRVLLWITSSLLCGPLAAVYSFVILAELCGLYSQTAFPAVAGSLGLVILILVVAYARRYLANSISDTWLLYSCWFGVICALVILGDLTQALGWLRSHADESGEQLTPIRRVIEQCQFGGGFLMLCAVAAMLLAILVSLLAIVQRFIQVTREGIFPIKDLWRRFRLATAPIEGALGAAVGQLVVWSVLVPAIGTLLYPDKYGPLFSLHLLCVLPSIGCMAVVVALRRCWPKSNRLIVNLLVVWALVLAVIVAGLLYVDVWLEMPQWVASAVARVFEYASGDYWIQISGVVLTVGAFLFVVLAIFLPAQSLGVASHVVSDVMNHFYRPGILVSPFHKADPKTDYTIQARINHRVKSTLEYVLDQNPAIKTLTIVAHSQGTMNAILTLNYLAAELDVELRLVTMGSPFSHLYQYYFPARYPPLHDSRWRPWTDHVTTWVNIFRPDDYVGTTITEHSGKPENREIAAPLGLGHVNYWRKRDIIPPMTSALPWN